MQFEMSPPLNHTTCTDYTQIIRDGQLVENYKIV